MENTRSNNQPSSAREPLREYRACIEACPDATPDSNFEDREKFNSLLKKIENNILLGDGAKASLLSYCYLCLSCKAPSPISTQLINDLIYGPLGLSADVVLGFLRILHQKGLPNDCFESLSVIPLGITYNLPMGSMLYNESLNESLFKFIENLLDSILMSNTPSGTLEIVYQEINTFFSEYSRILVENGLSFEFKKWFERIEDKWIRFVSLLSSNTHS